MYHFLVKYKKQSVKAGEISLFLFIYCLSTLLSMVNTAITKHQSLPVLQIYTREVKYNKRILIIAVSQSLNAFLTVPLKIY